MGLDPARDSSNRLPSRNLRNDKTPIEIPCGFAILVVHGSDRFVCSSTFLSLDEDGSVLPTERQNCYEKDSWSQNQPKRGSQLKDLRKKGCFSGSEIIGIVGSRNSPPSRAACTLMMQKSQIESVYCKTGLHWNQRRPLFLTDIHPSSSHRNRVYKSIAVDYCRVTRLLILIESAITGRAEWELGQSYPAYHDGHQRD